MSFVITVTFGLCLWIVLWSIGSSGFDAFIITTAVIVAGATARVASGYLPGRRG